MEARFAHMAGLTGICFVRKFAVAKAQFQAACRVFGDGNKGSYRAPGDNAKLCRDADFSDPGGRDQMKRSAVFAGICTMAMLALPASGADNGSGLIGFRFGKNAFNFEGLPSGPQPLKNLSRRADGTAEAGRLVGDYNNPILTPFAAQVVKQKGELAAAGKGFPNSQDQCRQTAPPFTLAMQLTFEMLPTRAGDITVVYDGD